MSSKTKKQRLFGYLAVILWGFPGSAFAADCNKNGIEDALDLAKSGIEYEAGQWIRGEIVWGDFNGDGLLDIAGVTTHSSSQGGAETYLLNTYHNDGEGDFEDGQIHNLDVGTPYLLASINNANGYVDLFGELQDGEGGSTTILLRNRGDGSFVDSSPAPAEWPSPPDHHYPLLPAMPMIDLNGDGYQDRVVIDDENASEFSVRLSNGSQRFQPAVKYEINFADSQGDDVLALVSNYDLDGDGDQDLVFQLDWAVTSDSYSYNLIFFPNQGDGTLAESKTVNVSGRANYMWLNIEDLNQDGFPEFVAQIYSYGYRPHMRNYFVGLVSIRNLAESGSEDVNRNNIPDECERAVAGDYDGDRKTDITVARKMLGGVYWYVNKSESGETDTRLFGLSAFDTPLAGDFNGDGTYSPGVVRDWYGRLDWYYESPDGQALSRQWGLSGDTPLTGYFDREKAQYLVVVRNSAGYKYWFLSNYEGEEYHSELWGLAADTPFTGDLDGDGIDELIVARQEFGGITWYARTLAGKALPTISWGLAGDHLLPPADFDGDGTDDLVVTRRHGRFQHAYVRQSASESGKVIEFGLADDLPYVGNFSGKTAAEFAVYRAQSGLESEHYLKRINNATQPVPFGLWYDFLVQPEGLGVLP